MASPKAIEIAARMGRRAAEHWRDYGIPIRNPIPDTQPELAAAWRHEYVSSAEPHRHPAE